MSTLNEIKAILDALEAKRAELAKPEQQPCSTMRIEREIRNLRYCLEDACRKLVR